MSATMARSIAVRVSNVDSMSSPALASSNACGRSARNSAVSDSLASRRANANDSMYCLRLGNNAVHAAMAGRTEMVVGFWNHRFTHVPISLAVSRRKQVDPAGEIWQRVLEATGQPASMVGRAICRR